VLLHSARTRQWYERVTALLDNLARTVDTEQPWRTPRFAEWDAQTALTATGSTRGLRKVRLRMLTGAVHGAGSETASVWNGYVDGAISSGYRAADEVLRDL
jgi:monoamine oxidase